MMIKKEKIIYLSLALFFCLGIMLINYFYLIPKLAKKEVDKLKPSLINEKTNNSKDDNEIINFCDEISKALNSYLDLDTVQKNDHLSNIKNKIEIIKKISEQNQKDNVVADIFKENKNKFQKQLEESEIGSIDETNLKAIIKLLEKFELCLSVLEDIKKDLDKKNFSKREKLNLNNDKSQTELEELEKNLEEARNYLNAFATILDICSNSSIKTKKLMSSISVTEHIKQELEELNKEFMAYTKDSFKFANLMRSKKIPQLFLKCFSSK